MKHLLDTNTCVGLLRSPGNAQVRARLAAANPAHYGDIRSTLTQFRTSIGPNDLMIAAIARANGVTLVSHNIAEFSRVTGLTCEDWEAGP